MRNGNEVGGEIRYIQEPIDPRPTFGINAPWVVWKMDKIKDSIVAGFDNVLTVAKISCIDDQNFFYWGCDRCASGVKSGLTQLCFKCKKETTPTEYFKMKVRS